MIDVSVALHALCAINYGNVKKKKNMQEKKKKKRRVENNDNNNNSNKQQGEIGKRCW